MKRFSDTQWAQIEPSIPNFTGPGRPYKHSDRAVLEGIVWVLDTGARWSDLPRDYPPPSTCHDRFQKWVKAGAFERIFQQLIETISRQGDLEPGECFIDATFIRGKKGATELV